MISQRKIEHDVRLKDGEVSVLGGLIERDTTKNLNGIPGISQVPFLQYFSSDNSKEVNDQEVLIVLTPHMIRFPSITARTICARWPPEPTPTCGSTGTDNRTRRPACPRLQCPRLAAAPERPAAPGHR